MRVKTVQRSWFDREGERLDAGPYLSGALEARLRLDKLSARKDRLVDLTKGHRGGLFNGPQFKRNYVDSPAHGVPFLTASTILRADLSVLPLLRRRDAESKKLRHLQLTPGSSLISCSGTIGRMAYTRTDMARMWASQDVLKVVPDPERIPPGYLYAYLSSKFGVPLVVSGTYGAIIQHLEPEHIADLPVPRLGDAVEQRVHKLVEEAARKRTEAAQLLENSIAALRAMVGVRPPREKHEYPRPVTSVVNASQLQKRMDGYYFSSRCADARLGFENATAPSLELADVSTVFIPGIFKRRYAASVEYGYPYITGADVFQLAPTSNKYLMKKVADEYRLVLRKGMILIQEAGQLGGLIGRSVPVGHYLDGFACTNNMVRITPLESADTGYLIAVLSSPNGTTLVAREAAGSSIPHLDENRVKQIRIPWPKAHVRHQIGVGALRARDLRDEACQHESDARALVEKSIEEAT